MITTFTTKVSGEPGPGQRTATVSLTDQDGAVLWGPKEVTISSSIQRTVRLPRPVKVNLEQETSGGSDSCGDALVSWGGVRFSSLAGF